MLLRLHPSGEYIKYILLHMIYLTAVFSSHFSLDESIEYDALLWVKLPNNT